MNVSKIVVHNLLQKPLKNVWKIQTAGIYNRSKIGNRDWVAFGKSGPANYDDDPSFPFPAIRYKENTNELLALREKEKGDWRKLTIEEKKILYRASFRQTFSEVLAPTGQWKSIFGWAMVFVSLGLWLFLATKIFVLGPHPKTFEESWRRRNLRKSLDIKQGHITGVSSKWDYELDDWKK